MGVQVSSRPRPWLVGQSVSSGCTVSLHRLPASLSEPAASEKPWGCWSGSCSAAGMQGGGEGRDGGESLDAALGNPQDSSRPARVPPAGNRGPFRSRLGVCTRLFCLRQEITASVGVWFFIFFQPSDKFPTFSSAFPKRSILLSYLDF